MRVNLKKQRSMGSGLVVGVVETGIGPLAVVDGPEGLVRVLAGYSSVQELLETIRELPGIDVARWDCQHSTLTLLERYAAGKPVSFAGVRLDDGELTAFGRRVTRACRAIRVGSTASYSSLARKSGSPDAQRAVGSVMARNRWPIIVPCHRVVRSDGGIGGYSSPRGIAFKQRLLVHEAAMRR